MAMRAIDQRTRRAGGDAGGDAGGRSLSPQLSRARSGAEGYLVSLDRFKGSTLHKFSLTSRIALSDYRLDEQQRR
jgi:hypothetical protein